MSEPIKDKSEFSLKQLTDIFKLNRNTIVKMIGDVPPSGKNARSDLWNISDIVTLNDVRKKKKKETHVNQFGEFTTGGEGENDPDLMTPAERRLHWQGEDLRQATMIKERRNATEARQLIPALEVEQASAAAFKTVALMLDTLPDALERDGIISSADIQVIIGIVDSSREQLANDLSNLSPVVEQIQREYYE